MAILPFIAALEIAPLRTGGPGSRRRAAIRLLPYAVATSVYLVLRWVTLSRLGIQPTFIPGFGTGSMERQYIVPPLWERLLDNVYIIPHYLLTVIWPTSLSPIYVTPDDLKPLALPLAAAWIFIIGILAWLFTRGRSGSTLFGLFWLIAFWLPVSGIVYFSDTAMADRYLYIPAIGLWIIVADQAARLLPAGSTARRYAMPVVLLVLLLLASLTVRRNMDWKNDIALCSRLIEQYPKNAFGHANLGAAYIERRGEGDLQLAEKEFETALALDPSAAQDVYTPLGYIKLTKGDFKSALYFYTKALEISPENRDARINRGITYERLGMTREALADYRQYLSIPSYNDIPGSREYAEDRVRELSR